MGLYSTTVSSSFGRAAAVRPRSSHWCLSAFHDGKTKSGEGKITESWGIGASLYQKEAHMKLRKLVEIRS